MYVAGLIPYLRSIDPWYLFCFTEDARYLHRSNHWVPQSKQILTADELGMGDNVYIDDHLNCSDEPTAIRPVSNTQSAYIEVVIPEVEITGTIPPLLQETDSVSTFRSKKKDRSVARGSVTFDTHTDNQRDSQKPSASSYKTANEGNVPKDLNKDMEDGSVSKLSDTASRLSAFEERFNMVTEEITDTFEEFKQTQTEQRELLTTILRHL